MVLVAGVIDTTSNYVEHPEVVADRLAAVARSVGDPHRVIAGTDCGFDTSAGIGDVAPSVVWEKLRAAARRCRPRNRAPPVSNDQNMSQYSDRYRKVAAAFTERVNAVPKDAWDNPAPCEGWVARDVVRHLVEWMPWMFFESPGVPAPTLPSVDDDPAGAWSALDAAIQAALDDPEIAGREFDMQMGRYSVEQAVDMFGTGDVLVHTWDLARATGLDETLDPDEVHAMFGAMEPMDEMLRSSGQFGPRVTVPDDADEQTKLIAFTGRQP